MAQLIKSENDLACYVAKGLLADGWTVYEEVRLVWGGRRADLVAVRGPLVRVVECKLQVSFLAIEQAQYWTRHAHQVDLCTYRWRPAWGGKAKGFTSTRFAELCAAKFGVGWLRLEESETSVQFGDAVADPNRNYIQIRHDPSRFHRPERIGLPGLKDVLCDEMLFKGEAGTSGKYWTPYKATLANLTDFVAKNPGCLMKEAIAGISHHYASDKSAIACITRDIQFQHVDTLRLEKVGGKNVVVLVPENKLTTTASSVKLIAN